MTRRPFPSRSGGNTAQPSLRPVPPIPPALPVLPVLPALPALPALSVSPRLPALPTLLLALFMLFMLLMLLMLPVPGTNRAQAAEITVSGGTPGTAAAKGATAPLRVFILDQPPWSYLHEGQPYGAAVDVARAVLHRLGRAVEFVVTPFNRGLSLVRQGKLDAALAVYRTPEREQYLHYTTVPLYDEDVILMVHPDDRHLAADTSGTARDAVLYGDKPVALALGYSYGPTLDAIIARKGLIRTSSFYSLQEGVQAVLRREAAAVPGTEPTLRALLHRLAPGSVPVLLRPPYDYISAYMAFAPTNANALLAADFDATLGRMRASGEYTRILDEADRTLHAHQGQ
ncbi:substrate-binding periplasmic protein [Nitratidesulfovibrio termitidis]|uniref:substrate-binding periplasmic protein n=1 Tax=Nitratidesulfovibrio termitidis TaxID=42252 RepID=UPI00042A65AB|nr:transporter substrate-binding domain-containing protein [Nitratidesulfovibrio termitidis]